MTTLGKYDLHEELGRGGFGTVCRATDTTLGREVALKVLHPQLTTDPDFLDKFRKEARTVAQLKSRDIVTIYELGELDSRVFIAMEYMEGGSLREKLEKEGAMSFEETLKIMCQICAGLEVAHEQGLVHRDIKPANILFDAKGNAAISDFGLAKAISNSSISAMSSMGGVGTPAYRAPELWDFGPPVSAAADIYSLGCVLFEMITGRVLFDADTTERIITQHLVTGPKIPATFPVGTPAAIRGILTKALAKEPAQRFSSAKDLLEGIASTQQEQTPAPIRPQPQPIPAKEEPQKSTSQPTQSPVEKAVDRRLMIGLAVGGLAIAFLVWGVNAAKPVAAPAPIPAQTHTAKAEVKPTNTPLPTQVPTAVLKVGSSLVSEIDGMTMVYVPAGDFEMGSNDGDRDESPMHTVYLDAFYIDQTEVTNAQYKLCVQAGACGQPEFTMYYNDSNFSDYPVVDVNWQKANDYCEWAGRELPTEAQWEKAARGTDGRTYPWGEGIDCSRANYGSCDDFADTSPVGHYGELGASLYGVYDMAGNVREWVADWYGEGYYFYSPENNPTGPSDGDRRISRGGMWQTDDWDTRSAYRYTIYPDYTDTGFGFRCVRLP